MISKFNGLRKRFNSKRGNASSIPAGFQMAKAAMNGLRAVKRLLNVEKKFYDATNSSYIDYNGTLLKLSQMAAGTSNITRDGNSIKAVSLSFRNTWFMHASALNSFVRFIVFIDKHNAGTDPTISDVITGTGTTSVVNTPLRIDRGTRYKILYDKVTNLSIAGEQSRLQNKYLSLNHHLKFTGTNASDFYSGQIYAIAISSEQTFTPNLNMYSRLRYIDN